MSTTQSAIVAKASTAQRANGARKKSAQTTTATSAIVATTITAQQANGTREKSEPTADQQKTLRDAKALFLKQVKSGANNRENVFTTLDNLRPFMDIPQTITAEFRPDYMGILADIVGKEKAYFKGCSGLHYLTDKVEYTQAEFKVYRYAYNLIRDWFKVRGLIISAQRGATSKSTAQTQEGASAQASHASPIEVVTQAVELLKEYEDSELLPPAVRDCVARFIVAFTKAKK